jgi:hypothetical protein
VNVWFVHFRVFFESLKNYICFSRDEIKFNLVTRVFYNNILGSLLYREGAVKINIFKIGFNDNVITLFYT